MSGAEPDESGGRPAGPAPERPWPPPGPDTAWWRGGTLPATTPRVVAAPPPVIVAAPGSGLYPPPRPSPRGTREAAAVASPEPPAATRAPGRAPRHAAAEVTADQITANQLTAIELAVAGMPERTHRHAAAARRRPSRKADDEAALLHALFHPAPAELATSLLRIPEPRTGAAPVTAPRRRPRPPRRLSVALPTLIVLAFATAFFAWVSAMPIWLAVGHSRAGTATVAACPLHGIPRSCATFMAADHSYSAWVTLLGPGTEKAATGRTVAAEMTSTTSNVAYAGSRDDLYLRLGVDLAVLLACGAGIGWATGALRLGSRRARMIALAGSFGGPLLLLLGMLAATF